MRQTGPLFVTSANLAGEKPLNSREEIEYTLGVVALDDECGNQRASTIVMVKDGSFEILREGPITIDEIESVIKN